MATPHCSLDYHQYSIQKLETFAAGVKTGIYGNDPPFTLPPITEAQLNTLIENYHHTYDDYKNGGKLKKPFFMAAKAALIAGLDTLEKYVDDLPGLSEEIILMAGFNPTKVVDSEGQIPAQPSGPTIKRGGAGEMFAEVPKVDGANYYGCLVFANQPLPEAISINAAGQIVFMSNEKPDPKLMEDGKEIAVFIMDVTKSRKKRFVGLETGMNYFFYFYAGNATGVSVLSEPRTAVCG